MTIKLFLFHSLLFLCASTLCTACKRQDSPLTSEQEAKLQKIFDQNPEITPEQKEIVRQTLIRAIKEKSEVKPAVPNDPATCVAKNGVWGKQGLSEDEYCILKTADAGKPCTSSSQCETKCVANDDSGLFATGDKAAGHCYGSTSMVGFSGAIIEEGRVDSHLDVD